MKLRESWRMDRSSGFSSMTRLLRPALVVVFVLLSAVHSSALASTTEAEQAVIAFYDAIRQGKCEEAVQLRDDYTVERCQEFADARNLTTVLGKETETETYIVFSVDLTKKSGEKETFKGYVTVVNDGRGWRIWGSSIKAMKGRSGLEAYITELESIRGSRPRAAVADPNVATPQEMSGRKTDLEQPIERPAGAASEATAEANAKSKDLPHDGAAKPAAAEADPTPKNPPKESETKVETEQPAMTAPKEGATVANIPKPRERPRKPGVEADPAQPAEAAPEGPAAVEADPAPKAQPGKSETQDEIRDLIESSERRLPGEDAARQPEAELDLSKPEGAPGILGACWKPKELAGKSGEGRIRSDAPDPLKAKPVLLRPKGELTALPKRFRGSIRSVDTGGKKLVALTFDFCEQLDEITGYDSAIIEYLRRHRIPATLFVGGKWMRDHQERTLQLMADPLFELANHAWTHGNLRVLSGKAAVDQILFTQAQYQVLRNELAQKSCVKDTHMSAVPTHMTAFRFPYGVCNRESLEMANSLGLTAIQWNVVSGDPARLQSAAGITRTVLRQIKPGSIVVMHGNGRGWKTAKALAQLIPELHKRGYRFLTVSDLLKSGRPVIADSCYELKPGDNLHYDKLFGAGTGESANETPPPNRQKQEVEALKKVRASQPSKTERRN